MLSSLCVMQYTRKVPFLSEEGPLPLQTLALVFRISAVHQPFYISICISTLTFFPQYTTFIKPSDIPLLSSTTNITFLRHSLALFWFYKVFKRSLKSYCS